MSRSRKGKPRCPSGHKCDWCGPKVAADRRDARISGAEFVEAYEGTLDQELADEAMETAERESSLHSNAPAPALEPRGR